MCECGQKELQPCLLLLSMIISMRECVLQHMHTALLVRELCNSMAATCAIIL